MFVIKLLKNRPVLYEVTKILRDLMHRILTNCLLQIPFKAVVTVHPCIRRKNNVPFYRRYYGQSWIGSYGYSRFLFNMSMLFLWNVYSDGQCIFKSQLQ